MGLEISKNLISKTPQFESKTKKCLETETELLKKLFINKEFSEKPYSIGLELETCLLDNGYNPSPKNTWLLKNLTPSFVSELSRYNVEYNSLPFNLSDIKNMNDFDSIKNDWKLLKEKSALLDQKVTSIGILPTLTKRSLQLKSMTPKNRYRMLNQVIMDMRNKEPFNINIKNNKESISLKQKNVMAGAATTSLQVHLKVPFSESTQTMNAASIISGPLVAITANSPFLYGKELWDETRIPLFEQSVDPDTLTDISRSTFGYNYVKESLFEMFEDNLKHPSLFTLDSPQSSLTNIKLHNGTVWRWNRPVIGEDDNGTQHLRIEIRAMSSGPTLTDVIANTIFSTALTLAIADESEQLTEQIPFSMTKKNFYSCAKDGLNAKINWTSNQTVSVQKLLIDTLIPKARQKLQSLTSEKICEEIIDNVILPRAVNGQNGSTWQKNAFKKYNGDFHKLMQSYLELEESGLPVHLWTY